MIRILLTALAFAVVWVSCGKYNEGAKSFNKTEHIDIINTQMKEQEDAWNRADIDGFMKHYWNSDSLCFIGKRGLSYGWTTTRDNYTPSYPDATAMGRLKFTNEVTDILDAENAYVIGKWELFRVADTLSGHYSLLWKKINSKWVIVADHSS